MAQAPRELSAGRQFPKKATGAGHASSPTCRYDVLLNATQPPGAYWVSSQVQFRPGSPAGYGVQQYAEINVTMPSTPPPQPASVAPWTPDQLAQIKTNPETQAAAAQAASDLAPAPEAAQADIINGTVRWWMSQRSHQHQTTTPFSRSAAPLLPNSLAWTRPLPPPQVPNPTVRLLLNMTQPLLQQTGQIRWAINVAHMQTPPCTALLRLLQG